MGRHSGFLAIKAALAQQDANFVLIPEVDFDLNGDNGLFKAIETRLKQRKHAVIIVAEGAGQKFFKNTKNKHDASGNIKLNDIGIFLKQNISNWFANKIFLYPLNILIQAILLEVFLQMPMTVYIVLYLEETQFMQVWQEKQNFLSAIGIIIMFISPWNPQQEKEKK